MRYASQLTLLLLVTLTAGSAEPNAPLSPHARNVQQQVNRFFPGAEIVVKRPHLPPLLAILDESDDASFNVHDLATNAPIHLTFEEVSGVRAHTTSKSHHGEIIVIAIAVATGLLVAFVGLRE